MNRKWIVPLVIAVAAGLIAYGATKNAACRRTAPPGDRLQDVSFLTRELALDDAQAREIQRLHATLGAKLNDCCVRHCGARARLGRALASETNGTTQADAVVAEMCRAYEESERATLDQLRQVRAVLNTEQRKRFDAMIGSCLCNPREMGACSASTKGGTDNCRMGKEKPE